jgi:hypothetical protein
MSEKEYKPRFIFEMTEDEKLRSDKYLGQFGIRKAIFQPILDDVLDMIEKHGDKFIGVLVSGLVKPREVIQSLNRANRVSEEIER